MGALPNTLPSRTPRKPAAKATRASKLNKYGRDPGSPSERLRASSDYDAEKGYSPFFHAFLADLPRLSSGNSCTLLMLTLWAKSAGRGAKKGEPRPDWTLALSVEDLAQICRCDVRTIWRELVCLEQRGLAEVKHPERGQIEARLLYRDWEKLPDYKTEVVELEPTAGEVVEPEALDESKPGNQRVTGKSAVHLKAGAVSKVFPVSCGVRQFRYRADGPVDLDITAVIQAGELIVTSRLPEVWLEKLAILKTTSHVSNNLDSPARHGCREDLPKLPRVKHPRAAELHRIFDPVLAHSGASLLSMSSSARFSLAACEAIGDCNLEYLAKFVANKKIKSVTVVPAICGEALASWKASLILNAAGARAQDEIERMIQAERAELARQRAELAKGRRK